MANQNRVEVKSVNSFTDRYSPAQSISGNFLTTRQPAWSNNTFGHDTLNDPFRTGPLHLTNAYEFLDTAGEWYLNLGAGILHHIPRSRQNMNNVSVELPTPQSLVAVGGTYDAPAHDISFSGITFTGTSRLGPSGNQGYPLRQPGQTAIGIANAHTSGVGLGASGTTITRSEIAQNSEGGVVVGGVHADAHHSSDQRMVNRDITVSYNRVHDLGIEYRGIVSVLNTYGRQQSQSGQGSPPLPAPPLHPHHGVRQQAAEQLRPRRDAADDRRRVHLHVALEP
ncbi:hypothetical protein [Lentzea sp. HUAS12]|uniref:hypothetical protein n=1 Tax=Lentzea sp. HUAS12 TaxID=2951806 RepID=UPI0020A180E5|nr:hypothetical protein [Lentzea sp. HUAS12]USX53918.1 hypothetical protein ND450_07405 [Lentzea sp. HUAS12]